jgi:hypothetical protein
MIAIALCILAFAACYWAGRRSLGMGLVALMAAGYFYGLLRANLQTTFSHFIFDTGLIGLYLSQKWTTLIPKEKKRLGVLELWIAILILWPILEVFLPFQPLLISLVGLRGNMFFIPLIILGARLRERDLLEFASGLAFLNIVAFAFAVAEYYMGVPRFMPYSAVTRIIYISQDVAGGFFRIPSIFTSAHAYGGTMVGTLPFLLGSWQRAISRKGRLLALAGIVVSLLGVLMSATRSNFVIGSAMVIATVVTTRLSSGRRIAFLLILAGVSVTAIMNPRFQRFTSLSDTTAVGDRIAGSVNRGFFELLVQYPMGNGLGGGGSSIPYFLEGQVKNPIGLENQYSAILCEQGIIGLLLWLGFLGWYLTRAPDAFRNGPWVNSRRLAWCLNVFCFGTAFIGTGLLTSIPGTVVLLLEMGWTAVPLLRDNALPESSRSRGALLLQSQARLTYSR